MKTQQTSRRTFLRSAGAAFAAFTIVPRYVLGGNGYSPPSEQLTKAVIGVGNMGQGHLHYDGARLLAVCDVDRQRLNATLATVGPDVKGYRDFREVLERPDIDIVHIVTPPHWHAAMSIAAAKAGKDIWCEKPMTRTIGEGLKVIEAVRQYNRIFRLNTWFRFQDAFYGFGRSVKPIKKLVQSGMLGWPLKVTLNASTGFNWKFNWVGQTNLPEMPVPDELDYDRWLGPAPYKSYHPHRVHMTFRGYWDYDGGGLGDMGQHYLDPVQYLLDKDDTSPVYAEADAPPQHPDAAGTWRRIVMKYADGCQIVIDGEDKDKNAPLLEGPNGKLWRGFQSDIKNVESKLAQFPEPDPQLTDFAQAVRQRKPFAINDRNGHRSCTLVNLGKIALQVQRPLRFDSEKQLFIDDNQANLFIHQPMRSPWQI